MSEIFSKPPITVEQQLALLRSRGLIIKNEERALHYLSFISYYRLSGYAYVFEDNNLGGKRSHVFKRQTSFDDILNLYDFDRRLRLLVMDAIERIEVAVRTQCLKLAISYDDSHWYTKSDLFKSKFNHPEFIRKCIIEFNKSQETFINHYKANYRSPELPPSWMIIELLTVGNWSKLYENLVNRSDQKQISDSFKVSPRELSSWLHCITYIRNLCAHHARLWNRHFTFRPIIKPEYKKYLTPNNTFAAQAAMIHVLLKIISPSSDWTNKLFFLIKEHTFVNPVVMGFGNHWEEDSFWGINNSC